MWNAKYEMSEWRHVVPQRKLYTTFDSWQFAIDMSELETLQLRQFHFYFVRFNERHAIYFVSSENELDAKTYSSIWRDNFNWKANMSIETESVAMQVDLVSVENFHLKSNNAASSTKWT